MKLEFQKKLLSLLLNQKQIRLFTKKSISTNLTQIQRFPKEKIIGKKNH
jgi:hypothetical protein